MANLDTPLKRFSGQDMMMPWRGIHSLPDGTVAARDRQSLTYLYTGILATAPATIAAITGTATASITEADIVAGGKTIIITLTNDTWVAAGAAFNAERQAIINGLDSAQAEATGWNAEVRDSEVEAAVVRTSDTVVTITLSAAAAYDITAQETITVTVPSSALSTSLIDVTGTPTFTVSEIVVSDTVSGGKGDNERGPQYPSFKPTGLVDRPPVKAKQRLDDIQPPTNEDGTLRLDDAALVSAEAKPEIALRSSDVLATLDTSQLRSEEVSAEIGRLLKLKARNDEEEVMLLILMASSV